MAKKKSDKPSKKPSTQDTAKPISVGSEQQLFTAHAQALAAHAHALTAHALAMSAHAQALSAAAAPEALMSQAMTDPIVEECIRANSSGGSFDDTYRLDNIVGLRIDDLRVCLNDKLDLNGCSKRFGPISGSDTVGVLKDHAYQRYCDCHGG